MKRGLALCGMVILLGGVAHADEIRVLAAASLARPFQQAQVHLGKLELSFSFAGSQQLALQIAQGARADLFASADERWMNEVDGKGLLAGKPTVFARNRLIVITPAANPGRVESLRDLARSGLKVVLAADAVPIGRYSREALARLSAGALGGDFAARVLANVVSDEESVQGVVAKVQLGEADAGIAYASDVPPELRAKVHTIDIPDTANVVAHYFVGVLKDAPNPAGAAAFAAWLVSADGQKLLVQHGFMPAAGQ